MLTLRGSIPKKVLHILEKKLARVTSNAPSSFPHLHFWKPTFSIKFSTGINLTKTDASLRMNGRKFDAKLKDAAAKLPESASYLGQKLLSVTTYDYLQKFMTFHFHEMNI